MRTSYARRAAPNLAVGCLLGAATVSGMILMSAAPAISGTSVASHHARPASCDSHHTNVEGYDAADLAQYGNQAQITINQASALNNLAGQISRSLLIFGSARNDVEVGWVAGPGTGETPWLFAEWVTDGADSGEHLNRGLTPGTTWTFRVENDGGVGIWRFYFDGDASPFAYSPTMNFNDGEAVTNSEHYWTCDTLWVHFTSIRDAPLIGDWATGYSDLECAHDTSVNDWLFDRVSNNDQYVLDNSGVTCP